MGKKNLLTILVMSKLNTNLSFLLT